MFLSAPNYIIEANIIAAPLDFKWGQKIAEKIFGHEVDVRLYDAVSRSTLKASYAAGIAATEWIVYRLSSHTDTADALNRIEAAWASSIKLSASRDLAFRLSDKAHDSKNLAGGPLEIALAILSSMYARYSRKKLNLPESACRQLMLAQHVVPKAAHFDSWASQNLRKLAKVFPALTKPDTRNYDLSQEEAVPREFFNPEFIYTKDAAKSARTSFLAKLNRAENPYIAL